MNIKTEIHIKAEINKILAETITNEAKTEKICDLISEYYQF